MYHSIRDRNIGGREGRQNHHRCILFGGGGVIKWESHITNTSLNIYSTVCIVVCHSIERIVPSYNHAQYYLTNAYKAFYWVKTETKSELFVFKKDSLFGFLIPSGHVALLTCNYSKAFSSSQVKPVLPISKSLYNGAGHASKRSKFRKMINLLFDWRTKMNWFRFW